MTPGDLVFNEVYKKCLHAGCSEYVAHSAAITTLQKYKNNQFIKVSTLIKQSITDAKKFIPKKSKSCN